MITKDPASMDPGSFVIIHIAGSSRQLSPNSWPR
jgi:hypothetical protein